MSPRVNPLLDDSEDYSPQARVNPLMDNNVVTTPSKITPKIKPVANDDASFWKDVVLKTATDIGGYAKPLAELGSFYEAPINVVKAGLRGKSMVGAISEEIKKPVSNVLKIIEPGAKVAYAPAVITQEGIKNIVRTARGKELVSKTGLGDVGKLFKGEERKTITEDILSNTPDYGLREDGTPKGKGWLGELRFKDGKVATELSIGVNFDGKERLIPSIVPNLTKEELTHLLNTGKPTKEILGKAVAHAREQIKKGLSPFKEDDSIIKNQFTKGLVEGAESLIDPLLGVGSVAKWIGRNIPKNFIGEIPKKWLEDLKNLREEEVTEKLLNLKLETNLENANKSPLYNIPQEEEVFGKAEKIPYSVRAARAAQAKRAGKPIKDIPEFDEPQQIGRQLYGPSTPERIGIPKGEEARANPLMADIKVEEQQPFVPRHVREARERSEEVKSAIGKSKEPIVQTERRPLFDESPIIGTSRMTGKSRGFETSKPTGEGGTTLSFLGTQELYEKMAESAKKAGKNVEDYLKSIGTSPEDIAKFMSNLGRTAKEVGEQVVKKDKSLTSPLVSAETDITKIISNRTSEIIESTKPNTIIQSSGGIKESVKIAKGSMIEHDRNIRRAESLSQLLKKAVSERVPDQNRQMLIINAIEHKMKGKYWEQLNDKEKSITNWLSKEKDKLDKYVKENDILDTLPESEDIRHIFHHWINPETGKPYAIMYGKFSKGLPQELQRFIPTYEVGIEKGMIPATLNPGELIGKEWESVTRANNARQLFKTLHGVKGDPEGSIVLRKGKPPEPIRMIESWTKLEKQGLSDGYVRYDTPFLDKPIFFKSSNGTPTMFKGAVGVKEELYPFVRAYIENPVYGKLSELNFAAKSLKLGASLFHPVSLGMQELANIRVPFVHIPNGLKLAKELGPEVRILHQEGLELFKGYEDLGYRNQFFDNVSKLGKIGNVITYPISKMRDFIFDYVQPGMKVSFAHMQFNKMLPKYLEGTGFTKEEVMSLYEQGKSIPKEALQAARDVVKKADGHFSGEHYKRSLLETNRFMVNMYFSPEARRAWQFALLSPTWQREHLLVAKNVAKSFMPDKMIRKLGMEEMGAIKSQYRRYALGGAMIIGAVDAWNYMATQEMDGKALHLWGNPEGKGFSVRAWWNEPDGKKAYIRPLKSLFEVAEWTKDPFLKLSYKLSPFMTAIGEQLFGVRKYQGIKDIPKRAFDALTDVTTPIVVDQILKVVKGKKSPESAILPFFGMPTSTLKKKSKEFGSF